MTRTAGPRGLSAEAASALARRVARSLSAVGSDRRPVRLMEVCGTHTVTAWRSGLRTILPEGVELLSGPGCPVCVTPPSYVDRAVAISRLAGVAVVTFGDMVRVPGTESSLERERSRGADVRVVYSPTGALDLARAHPERRVVFLAVGFETTTPGIAATALEACREGVRNLFMLAAPRLIPPALEAVLAMGPCVDAFICPGHVSVIIGSDAYGPVAGRHHMPCVVTGFEPHEMLLGIAMAVEQVAEGRAEVEIAYASAVRPEGNPRARALTAEVFEPADAEWRGLGVIPSSGLAFREQFARMDAARAFDVEVPAPVEPEGCRCGEVLAGLASPDECPLFGSECTPAAPVGPCMVSSEGSCAARFKYAGARSAQA